MKKRGIVITIIALVGLMVCAGLITAGGLGAYFLWGNPPPLDPIAKRLSPGAVGVVAVGGLTSLALEFREPLLSVPSPEAQQFFQSLKEQSLKEAGFDATDPAAWVATGLDFSEPWAVASETMPEKSRMEIVGFIPVRDGKAATATMLEFWKRQNVTYTETKLGDQTAYVIQAKANTISVVLDRDYLIFLASRGTGTDPMVALQAITTRKEEQSLKASKDFQALQTAAGEDWQLFGWVSPTAVTELRKVLDKEIGDALSKAVENVGVRGAVLTQTLTNASTTVRLIMGNAVGSGVDNLAIRQRDKLASRVAGAPMGVFRWSLDLDKSWEKAMSNPQARQDLDSLCQDAREEWGVDLEKDVYHNLDGNFSMVALQGSSPKDMFGVGWVGVKDSAKAVTLLDSMTAKLKASGVPVSTDSTATEHWYSYSYGALGIAQDHLVAVVGDNQLAAVRTMLSEGKTSFLDQLPETVRNNTKDGPPVYAYIDVAALAAWGKASGLLRDPDIERISNTIVGYSFSAEPLKNDLMQVELAAVAPPQGFSGALFTEVLKEIRATQLKTQRTALLMNVDGIRTAEQGYGDAFSRYIACGSEEEAKAKATLREPYAFDASGGWTELGWKPDKEVQGGYYVDVTTTWVGDKFVVYGISDFDHDGVYAKVAADRWRKATLLTPDNVY